MGGFLDAAFGFPAVIFTVLLVPVVVYWLVVLLGALDVDLLGDVGEGPGGEGPGGDLDPGAGPDGGGLEGLWQALGLAGVPVTVALSLTVAFGWLVALLATAGAQALDLGAPVVAVGGCAALALAALAGARLAAVVGRPLARVFSATEAEGRAAFVGRVCTVRTARVTPTFGQAEATDPSGATVLVQVRAPAEAGGDGQALGRGETALIYDYDPVGEVFLVCRVDDEIAAG